MLWVIKVASYSPPSRSPACCGTGRHTLQITFLPVSQFPLLTLLTFSSFLPPMILLFQSSRPSRLLNISFQNPSAPSSPRASSRGGVFIKSLQVLTKYCCRHWCSIMEWNMTQDAGTENCSPPDCCSRRGKGGVRKGSNLGKWGRRQKNVKRQRKKFYPIQPFPAYYPLSRGSDCRPD